MTGTTKTKRKEEFLHTLTRLNIDSKCLTPEEQNVGSFAGFQSTVLNIVAKSKVHYFLTSPEPPEKSVVYEVMLIG